MAERWFGQSETLESFTIITTTANKLMQALHHRLPVTLDAADYAAWLDPDAKPDALQALLRPYSDNGLIHSLVSRRVNSPRNDDAACLAPN